MSSFKFLSLVSLLLVTPALAAPHQLASCNISTVVLQLPANQSALVAPTIPPSFIALAVGVQNYTCSSSSTYTSAGAVAKLSDISCLAKTPEFANISDTAKLCTTLGDLVCATLGEHYFVSNPPTQGGISPKWDFTSSLGNPNAFVIGAKVASIPAPTGPNDVDWLSLKSVQGELATQIFRTDTSGGQPPASCTPGSPLLSVPYMSKYWFYGGSIKN